MTSIIEYLQATNPALATQLTRERLHLLTQFTEMKAERDKAVAELSARSATKQDDSALRFVIPTPPSSKNMRSARVRHVPNSKPRAVMFMPREVKEAREFIQDIAVQALADQSPMHYYDRVPLISDDDVGVEMIHNVHNETVDVFVRRMGPRPKGRTGRKRDVVNLPELVLDAIQEIAYGNDNQVADLRVWRNVGNPTTKQ